MKYWIAICLTVFLYCNLFSQQNRMKGGFIGFPSSSGFGIGTLGYEKMNKELTKSWQLHINGSGGAIATDVGIETRKWITVERTFYHKTISKTINWSYSFFTEIGDRVKENGDRSDDIARIFDKRKMVEINSGANLGIQLRIGKKWGVETLAGPKVIFANGKEFYLDASPGAPSRNFTEKVSYIKAGFRLMGVVYIQF